MKSHGKKIIKDYHRKEFKNQIVDYLVDFILAVLIGGFITALVMIGLKY